MNAFIAASGIGRGGAIGTYAGTIKLDNCILYGNTSVSSPSGEEEDLFLFSNGPVLSDIGNNVIGVMDPATLFDAASTGNLMGVTLCCFPLVIMAALRMSIC